MKTQAVLVSSMAGLLPVRGLFIWYPPFYGRGPPLRIVLLGPGYYNRFLLGQTPLAPTGGAAPP